MKKVYERFTISLPKDLYDDFEHFRESLDMSRSDAIRKAMQAYMVREAAKTDLGGDIVGCITYILKHEHFEKISEGESGPKYASIIQSDFIKSNDIQHDFQELILSTMHLHLTDDNCMIIIAVKGSKGRIFEMNQRLSSLQSTINFDFSIVGKDIVHKNNTHKHKHDH